MPYTVLLANRAEKSLKRLPPTDLDRVLSALSAMADDPFAGDVVKLKGADGFRRRIGDYRIIFNVDIDGRTVKVAEVLRRTTTTYR